MTYFNKGHYRPDYIADIQNIYHYLRVRHGGGKKNKKNQKNNKTTCFIQHHKRMEKVSVSKANYLFTYKVETFKLKLYSLCDLD